MQNIQTLNNGIEIPEIGLGTYRGKKKKLVLKSIPIGLQSGYRLIDTAMLYKNEKHIGKALQKLNINRDEFFITTKVFKNAMRRDGVRESVEESLKNLQLDYADLVLIHRPLTEFNQKSWRVLEELLEEGLAKAIGVSNFLIKHLKALKETSKIIPAVNQIELHPFFYRKELVEYCQANGTIVEAYSPLALGRKFDDPRLVTIAQAHNKTSAQIMLRWSIQHGFIPIPRSFSEVHIKENIDVFDFKLTDKNMKEMNTWNEDFMVIGIDPDEPAIR